MSNSQQSPIVLSVSQLTNAIKLQLESTFPLVWVKGEVSNLKLQSSGHLYFTLKDEQAQVAAVAFRPDASKIALMPNVGDQVLVRAELNVWPPKGGYQLVVRELSHVGRGDQLIKLELLKQKLDKLGFFAKERKRALPQFPKIIGIVTSPTGAVIQDMLNILTRRMAGFHVILNPVKVQGEGADVEIAQAINQMNAFNLCDVLVVCRGGGSFEDLAPFNSELVAQAIFKSKIPVVSAVGHETDVTISDFVADLRAPTPSAAAELISHEQEELIIKLSKYHKQASHLLKNELTRAKTALVKCARLPLFNSSTALLGPKWQALDELKDDLDTSIKRTIDQTKRQLVQLERAVRQSRPSRKIQENKQILLQLEKQIDQSMPRYLKEKKQKLQRISALLESIHPKNVLKKGYSILFSQKDGSIISSIKTAEPGTDVRILFHDGQAEATINKVNS